MSQPENAGKKVNLRGVIDDAVFLVIFYICMKVLFNFFLTARGFPIEFVLIVISAVIGLAAAFLCARSGVRHNVIVLLGLYAVLLCVGCCVDYLAIHSEESGILRYLPQLLSVSGHGWRSAGPETDRLYKNPALGRFPGAGFYM